MPISNIFCLYLASITYKRNWGKITYSIAVCCKFSSRLLLISFVFWFCDGDMYLVSLLSEFVPLGNLPPGWCQNFVPMVKGSAFTFVTSKFQSSNNLSIKKKSFPYFFSLSKGMYFMYVPHFWWLGPNPTAWIPSWCSSSLLPNGAIQRRKIRWRLDLKSSFSHGFSSWQSFGRCITNRSWRKDLLERKSVI